MPALLLALALIACDTQGTKDAPSDDTEAPTWTGCADFARWDCSPSSGGCWSDCDDWEIACSPGTGSCQWSGPTGSGSCDDYEGSGCDACAWALTECVRDEM